MEDQNLINELRIGFANISRDLQSAVLSVDRGATRMVGDVGGVAYTVKGAKDRID